YQAEIAQGRLEALLNFQTMVADLTSLPLANASLLDEATAAAEAMSMARALARGGKAGFFVAEDCHPQTIAVVKTRAAPVGIRVHVGRLEGVDFAAQDLFGVLVQYPTTDGRIRDYAPLAEKAHAAGALLVAAADRLALQTREQHIRRDKATSNICTAQVLLAVMAAMYAVYHGPDGLRAIARRVHGLTDLLARGLRGLGFDLGGDAFFDTLRVRTDPARGERILARARDRRINLRRYEDGSVGVALDETVTEADLLALLECFAGDRAPLSASDREAEPELPAPHARTSPFLTHEVFRRYHSEHEMLRYLYRLQARDLSLVHSMIPLGSCTMKLNATTEMVPVTWAEFALLHPFAPAEQAEGYAQLRRELADWLAEITGFAAVSLQPNS